MEAVLRIVFHYLANSVEEDKRRYYNVRLKGMEALHTEEDVKKAIVKLSSLGLIRVDFPPKSQSYIIKEKEFYRAQELGFETWLKQHEVKIEKERKKANWDYKASWAKAHTWWLSIVALVISLASLGWQIYGHYFLKE
jgi:hypothetical protein